MSELAPKWAPAAVVTVKRKAYSPAQKALICERQNWLCNCGCGKSIKGKRYEINHRQALALGGTNDLENAEALLPKCHKPHTDGVKGAVSKADAQGGRRGSQYDRRKRNGSKFKKSRPLRTRNTFKDPSRKAKWQSRKLAGR